MRRVVVACVLLVVPLAIAVAQSDVEETLIALDKEWGEANARADAEAVGRILADDLVAAGVDGVATKADVLAGMEPEPEGTMYMADDYQVKMVGDDMAIMTHTVPDPQPGLSLHVWVLRDGTWQVIATAGIPTGS